MMLPRPNTKGNAEERKDGWHRSQTGVVSLSDRKLMVKRLRLRRKGKGLDREVTILAYESMRINESLTSIDKNKKVA